MPRKKSITQDTVRRLALAFPEATEGGHLGTPDFRVRNRIFAALPEDGLTVVLKCTPANVDALASSNSVTFKALWRGQWLGVRLDRIMLPMLEDLLADAWRLAAPKRLAASLASADGPVAIDTSTTPATPHDGKFKAKLFRHPGKGGWTFVRVPDRYAPSATHGWGRATVLATVDGHAWKTSVWRGKDGRTLLPVPKRARGIKEDGDSVNVELSFTAL